MKRRRFIGQGLGLLAAGLFGRTTIVLGEASSEMDGSQTAAEGSSGDIPDIVMAKGDPRDATRQAIDAIGGMPRYVSPGQVVVIKPNASFECPPAWGATTHPDVLSAVIEACFEAEAKRVLVIDHTMRNAERAFRRTGVADAVGAFPKAKLVSLDKERMFQRIPVPAGHALHETDIPVAVQKADVLINVPTAKSHSATGVSFGLKNLMGLVWDRQLFHDTIDLHMGIADLATVLRPQLTILDAISLLKTGGPAGPGEVVQFGGVIAGTDPVAVDAFGVGVTTWNGRSLRPTEVAYLTQAAEHGLGSLDLDALDIRRLDS